MRRLLLCLLLGVLAGCGKKPTPLFTPPTAVSVAPTAASPDATPAAAADAGATNAAPGADGQATPDDDARTPPEDTVKTTEPAPFKVQTEQFADVRILRYQIPGWDQLPLPTKQLAYYLSEAALAGRDIAWDQRHPEGLRIRRTLEAIDGTWKGDRASPEYAKFQIYLKRVWFSHGLYHHFSNAKFQPEFSAEFFAKLVIESDASALPLGNGETPEKLVQRLTPLLFDATVDPHSSCFEDGKDLVKCGANNFYARDLTQAEVEGFYATLKKKGDAEPPMFGLNSKLVRENGALVERTWKIGGMYGAALKNAVHWLEKAVTVAENDAQKAWLVALIKYYQSGDLKDFDAFNVAWVKDTESTIDLIHGFIETYGDGLDMRGTYEAIVELKDPEATKIIGILSKNAQWFEDHSPILGGHKKTNVVGISARVVNVVTGTGDSGPAFPIGVNLPNSDWIRKVHGSKSVSLGNIVAAYEEAKKSSGVLEEFAANDEAYARMKAHANLSDRLQTDLHEVIGHASGQLEPGVLTASETLKNFASTLEEARADIVALYYVMDPKLVELGLMPSLEVGKAGYDAYIQNALLVQLARIPLGEDIVEAHMRNRHLIAQWALEKGGPSVIAKVEKAPGKSGFLVKDHAKLRELFGELLREIQRIKSQGDFKAGKALVETYGIKIDPTLHAEVRGRWDKLGVAPYAGFINPRLRPIVRHDGEIVDVVVEYPEDFAAQMREYGLNYGTLPTDN